MEFKSLQVEWLKADLKLSNVKTREQSGRKLSFIEGWKAIEEANRIFGFDGWSSETVEVKCVSEKPRKIKDSDGWGVTYIAKCRITIGYSDTLVREGCGTGHGIDRDLGQAHESAIKEAETDARKRALMTFGNQFGLALYDKTQENVVDDTKGQDSPEMARILAVKAAGMTAAKEGMDAFKAWGQGLSINDKSRIDSYIKFELMPIAKQKP